MSLACPWAHRTLILRALKGLEPVISVSVVHPLMHDQGWSFGAAGTELPQGSTPDHLYGAAHLWQIYVKANPHYSGKVTVPVLWDKHTARIVNNESPEILRMLNSAFDALATRQLPDLYPLALQPQIEQWNERIYHTVNNGVYRAGFATRQDVYEQAVRDLFDTLDVLEVHLSQQRYLCGRTVTEADWRLFPTLVRFDAVYHGHFKCNLRRLIDYPNLWAYTRELYQWPGVAETVNHQQNRQHYYASHAKLNPTGIVALGPNLDWHQPHLREGI